MNTKTFKPEPNETDKEFRERVHTFAEGRTVLAITFSGDTDKADKAEVLYFD